MIEISLGEIPFYYNMQKVPKNPEGIPDVLPFSLGINKSGIIFQKHSAIVASALKNAYQRGSNISGLMDIDGIGKEYAEDFLRFIKENIKDFAGKRVLEIGCGTGYLLSLVRNEGAEVLGVEPGGYSQIGLEKWNLKILQKFFDVNDFTNKFDVIIFYGVLEHIYDYEKFFQDVKSILAHEGKIFCSVPDCQPYFEHGDISVFMHEHYNYFTLGSMEKFLMEMGMNYVVRVAGFGGAIYSCCSINSAVGIRDGINTADKEMFANLEMKIIRIKNVVKRFLEKNSSRTIGIYCPIRLINYISQYDKGLRENIRFFDDDKKFHGLYYPGINIPIENYDDLVDDKVDIMLIASWTFSNVIKKKCEAIGISRCFTIKDLLDEDSNTF